MDGQVATNLGNIKLCIQKIQPLMDTAASFFEVYLGGLKNPNAHGKRPTCSHKHPQTQTNTP
jgi:hypothetical protein